MHNDLGHSVSLSEYLRTGELPASILEVGNSPIFLSLQIAEEFNDDYVKNMEELCGKLNEFNCKILADISPRTLTMFQQPTFLDLKNHLNLWGIRVDFGLTFDEIKQLSKQMPLVINASTTSFEEAKQLAEVGLEVYAMHNYYPRPDTGLDPIYFDDCNKMLKEAGLKVMAFIPGDISLRGPLYERLPTLESHRYCTPYQGICRINSRL